MPANGRWDLIRRLKDKVWRKRLIDILKVEPGLELWTIQLILTKVMEGILLGKK